MKTPTRYSILTVLLIVGLLSTLHAQNEQKGFSFQGYARDFSGAAYSSTNITAKFSVYPDGESDEYVEEHSLTTDAYGVFSANIGSITPVNFALIDFSSKNYFMKVEVKVAGGDFVEISNTELLAVPYAKAAERASNGTPAGTVISFAGASAPAGYLVCDGSAVSSATYPELYAAIGNLWGGDATNFNLPDLRGQFLRGQDNGAGVDPDVADRVDVDDNVAGDVVGSYQKDVFQGHHHQYEYSPRFTGETAGGIIVDYAGITSEGAGAPGRIVDPITDGVNGDPRISSESRPKNAYVLYMIKY